MSLVLIREDRGVINESNGFSDRLTVKLCTVVMGAAAKP
jgi:hypothetical protein